jgi:outer membrane scaffolding protein for murein synthesis (MipA/OmpV family)
MHDLFRPLGLVALTLASANGFAQIASPAAVQPLWEIGAFGFAADQQAYPGSDQQVRRVLALPYLVYRGRIFRADNEGLQLRAFKSSTMELDIGLSGSVSAGSGVIDARRGMPGLGTLLEAGPRLKWNLGDAPGGATWRATLPLRGVFDASNSLAWRGMAFEPDLSWQRRSSSGWSYGLGVATRFGSRQLTDTFYGVAPAYANASRPAYEARAGLISTRLSLTASKKLSDDWRLLTYARLDTVSGAANAASPLIRRNTGATVGIGLAYTLMRSERPAED